jgi:hypothetical protein
MGLVGWTGSHGVATVTDIKMSIAECKRQDSGQYEIASL